MIPKWLYLESYKELYKMLGIIGFKTSYISMDYTGCVNFHIVMCSHVS